MKKKKNKRKLKKSFVIIFSVLLVLVLALISFFVIKSLNGKKDPIKLTVNGDEEVFVNVSEVYVDTGATATFDDEDISDKIEVENNVDTRYLGEYKVTYKVNYNNYKKEIERTVHVIDTVKPDIQLNGVDEITIATGNTYNDLGALVLDNVDGNITDKLVVDSSNVDMETPGTYKVIYTAKDSSDNEAQKERIINVVPKGPDNQRVPVLNYHFFYESKDENCNESICENMDKFREQLQYLNDNGFHTLTIKEFRDWMYGEYNIPEKSILITIDDGGKGTGVNNGNHLIPALEEYKIHATIFIIAGWWSPWEFASPYLDVQSHTYLLHYEAKCGHRSKVNCVSYDELLNDLNKSIEIVNDTTSFCFPFYESTDMSIKAVQEAGFDIAFVGGSRKASRNDNKYLIPRYPIQDYMTLENFKQIVN